jgi:hypothetical protein
MAIRWSLRRLTLGSRVAFRVRGTHIATNDDYAPPPTLSACGTAPTVVTGSTDTAGEVIFGTGTVPSCTLNFGTKFTVNTTCTFASDGSPLWYYEGPKNGTSVTINGGNCPSGNCQNSYVAYHCFGIGGT